jgi:PAS domain S-box-containing protein
MANILKSIAGAFKKIPSYIPGNQPRQELLAPDLGATDILECITDGFFAVNRDWTITYYNPAAERMLLPGAQIINRNLWSVFGDSVGSKFHYEYQMVMNDKVPASFEEFYPPLNLWVQIQAYPANEGISIYFRDITENKRQLLLNKLETKVFAHYTGKGSTIESTIRLILDGIREIHPGLVCSVLKVEQNRLKYFAFSHLPAAFIQATDNSDINLYFGYPGTEPLPGEETGYIDITTDPKWDEYREMAIESQLKVCISFPLFDPWQKLIGTFSIWLQTARQLGPAEEVSLQKVKYILGHILQNHVARENIKLSEEKYRDLFNLHPLPLWLYDFETLRFVDVNEAAIRHYGYSREEFMRMTIKDIRASEDIRELKDKLHSIKINQSFSRGIFKHKKKNGDLIYAEVRSNRVDFNGTVARLIISTDVSDKVEVERTLNLSEKRFKAMVQEGSDLINVLDSNGAYTYASPASMAMFGKKPEEVIGSYAMHFIHEDDQKILRQMLEEIKETRRVQTSPYRFRMHTGEFRWLQSIGTNLLDDPAVNGIVINSKDITDSVNYILAIEVQNARLKDIAWIQSHVVRAPLARIMGLIELIKTVPEDRQLNSELLEHILCSAHELDKVISDIVSKTEQSG